MRHIGQDLLVKGGADLERGLLLLVLPGLLPRHGTISLSHSRGSAIIKNAGRSLLNGLLHFTHFVPSHGNDGIGIEQTC